MPEPMFNSAVESLPLESKGKVRDMYGAGDDHMLIVATDRLSAFDVVFPSPIPGKGGLPGKVNRKNIALSLFDLKNDVGETTNVANKHPEVVKRLMQYAEEMRKDLGHGADAGPGRRPIGRS